MFLCNQWLWFHILISALLTKILLYSETSKIGIFLLIFSMAILWEFIEYFTTDIEKVYGSKIRFLYNSIGDIIGALIISSLILM